MEVTYQWQILGMKEYPQQDGLSNVVFYIRYNRIATTIVNEKEYKANFVGEYLCPFPSSSDFIPFNQLTKEIVDSWLNAGVDHVSIDAGLLSRLQDQVTPTEIELPLPWTSGSIN